MCSSDLPLRPGDVLQIDATCMHDVAAGRLQVAAQCWRRETAPVAIAQIKLWYVLEH